MPDKPAKPRTIKPVTQMTAEELLNRDMHQVEWEKPTIALTKKRKKNLTASLRSKNDPRQLAQLASVREGTQIGGPNIRRCTKIAKATGEQCRCQAIRGFDVCWRHSNSAIKAVVRERRRAAGAPVALAHVAAINNIRYALRRQLIPYELMRQPVFVRVLKIVAPYAFGLPRNKLSAKFTRDDLKTAALLCRELALTWINAEKSGDWQPWTQAVAKARKAGYLD